MNIHKIVGARQLAVVATAALAVGFGTARPAVAASSASASVANNTLTITGTSGADRIALSLAAGDPNTLQVDGSIEQTFDRSTFSAIAVSLGSGDDEFLDQQGPLADEAVTIDAGSGDDTIVGGNGNDLIFGGSGNDTIASGAGDDIVFAGSGNDVVDGGLGRDVAFLDSGQDLFQWFPGEGSDVIDGGSGNDALFFSGANVSENMSLSANGTHSVFLRNVGNIRMDMDNVERLNLAALGGADNVTINDMKGTDFREANIDLSVPGGTDQQADVVTVNGTENADHVKVDAAGARIDVAGLKTETHITGSEQLLDQLQVNSRGGNDTVDVAPGVSALIGVAVDLGSGQL